MRVVVLHDVVMPRGVPGIPVLMRLAVALRLMVMARAVMAPRVVVRRAMMVPARASALVRLAMAPQKRVAAAVPAQLAVAQAFAPAQRLCRLADRLLLISRRRMARLRRVVARRSMSPRRCSVVM